ncbi:hypothetical protein [Vibrio metschnikovii]|uniref:hypothetical protein n=1 Tax=Vibrio metschnikovii TaxID=28172 RepID=UPI001C306504|nr:hypothetical protein [Vibrio metschnikovii]
MNVSAYSQFSELTPVQLLSVFKDEYRTIAKDNRTLSLNQGYQALAKHAQCNSLESMKSQSIILIKVSEFINALIACGLPVSKTTNTARFERLLKCDVLCPPLSGGLCVAVFFKLVVIICLDIKQHLFLDLNALHQQDHSF